MTYAQSLAYLQSLGNEVSAMKLGLENIRKLLAALQNPEKNYLKIQIAGTNGKGSTCAFLEAMCVAAGIEVGVNTSPHLIKITERIRVAGREIAEVDFARHASRVRETAEELIEKDELETVPTFFEQITAIALSYFAEAEVELAILETGLGGRFDAVTATNAEIAALTPIGFDHQEILGATLTEIAAEKAAIIRANMRVVVAEQPKDALDVILRECDSFGIVPRLAKDVIANEESGSPRASEGRNAVFEKAAEASARASVFFRTEKTAYKNIRLGLLGKHQIENAKTAVLLAEVLQDEFKITTENITEGLQKATHKGRLEYYKNILFDGAHNAAGAKALREYFDEFVARPITLIFGATREKDVREIAAILFPKAEILILTKSENTRASETAELLKFVPQDLAKENLFVTETVEEALKVADKLSGDKNLICVTGSLYLVGEAQEILKNAF